MQLKGEIEELLRKLEEYQRAYEGLALDYDEEKGLVAKLQEE